MSLIELEGVTKRYHTGARIHARSGARSVTALQSLSLTVAAGEFVCLTGRSGSGKSTLLNLLGGLDRADSGQVQVGGVNLQRLDEDGLARWRRTQVGVVFQFFHLLPNLTALENVLFPMELGSIRSRQARRERADELLGAVGLAECAGAFPAELSGGQQQRVAIARALANDPPLLLADEPTGNLDSAAAAGVVQLFEQIVRRGCTLVLATHDGELAGRAGRVVHLLDGQIQEG